MPSGDHHFNVQLQPRDTQLLLGLYASRLMTLPHIATIYFGNRTDAAKKRVQKLKRAGLIRQRPRRFSEPSLLFLSNHGLTLLSEHIHLAGAGRMDSQFRRRLSVSALMLRHELSVLDVKAATVASVLKREQLKLHTFSTWPSLYEFRTRQQRGEHVVVKPDGFVVIEELRKDEGHRQHAFFLEVDRSTERLDILVSKACCYRNYYLSGGFSQRHGSSPSEYKTFPFRVLFILKTVERRNNVARTFLEVSPPFATQMWLTTLDEAKGDPLGCIWITPRDFAEAAKQSTGEEACRSPSPFSRSCRLAPDETVLIKRALLD